MCSPFGGLRPLAQTLRASGHGRGPVLGHIGSCLANVGNPLALADIPLRSQPDSLARRGVLPRPRPVSVSSVGCRRSLGLGRSHSACRVAGEGSPGCRDPAAVSGRLHDKPSAALRDSASRSSCTLGGRSGRPGLACRSAARQALRCASGLRFAEFVHPRREVGTIGACVGATVSWPEASPCSAGGAGGVGSPRAPGPR